MDKKNIAGLNTTNVTDMSFLFFNCSNLKTLDTSGFDLSNVSDVSTMYLGTGWE